METPCRKVVFSHKVHMADPANTNRPTTHRTCCRLPGCPDAEFTEKSVGEVGSPSGGQSPVACRVNPCCVHQVKCQLVIVIAVSIPQKAQYGNSKKKAYFSLFSFFNLIALILLSSIFAFYLISFILSLPVELTSICHFHMINAKRILPGIYQVVSCGMNQCTAGLYRVQTCTEQLLCVRCSEGGRPGWVLFLLFPCPRPDQLNQHAHFHFNFRGVPFAPNISKC